MANNQIKGEKLTSINVELDEATETAKNGLSKILNSNFFIVII